MRIRTSLLLTGLFMFGAIAPAVAEVSTDPVGAIVNTIIMGTITEDPAPIGTWVQYRAIPADRVLNPGGDARGDGRPDIQFATSITDDPDPVGTWSYNAGTDFDIALSEWDGTQWTPTVFLSSSMDDDLDPRLAIEADGTIHVVWWTSGATEKVYLATRPAGSSIWDPTVLVTDGSEGRRPSIAIEAGVLRVAYERDTTVGGMAQDVVIATRQPDDSFAHEIVRSTGRTDRLDVMIHNDAGHLWIDWMDAASAFGCAEWQGSGWASISPQPWADPSWIGVENMRKVLRTQVLQP